MTKIVGYAPGAYDMFHVGHLNILRHAKQHCDHLIAGVVSDEMLRLTKGLEPVVPLDERLEIVRSIRYVDDARDEVVAVLLRVAKDVEVPDVEHVVRARRVADDLRHLSSSVRRGPSSGAHSTGGCGAAPRPADSC